MVWEQITFLLTYFYSRDWSKTSSKIFRILCEKFSTETFLPKNSKKKKTKKWKLFHQTMALRWKCYCVWHVWIFKHCLPKWDQLFNQHNKKTTIEGWRWRNVNRIIWKIFVMKNISLKILEHALNKMWTEKEKWKRILNGNKIEFLHVAGESK